MYVKRIMLLLLPAAIIFSDCSKPGRKNTTTRPASREVAVAGRNVTTNREGKRMRYKGIELPTSGSSPEEERKRFRFAQANAPEGKTESYYDDVDGKWRLEVYSVGGKQLLFVRHVKNGACYRLEGFGYGDKPCSDFSWNGDVLYVVQWDIVDEYMRSGKEYLLDMSVVKLIAIIAVVEVAERSPAELPSQR